MELFSLVITIFLGLALAVNGCDVYSRNEFPDGFVFGAASSAYQWEGAANEDGRMPSIWDTFAHAGNGDGNNGDIACDGYHKYKEDVRLMADADLDAFRLSISWSRLIPRGRGTVNWKGLRFYKNLINELTSHGIQPHVTLYHYDLPQALEDEYGGWLNRKVIKDFTAYADVCFREFGDTVKFWTTLNEPNAFVLGGYDNGIGPPGRCSPPFGFVNCSHGNSSAEPYIALHNMLLAHASAARLYKNKYKMDIHSLRSKIYDHAYQQRGSVGISIYTQWMVPFTSSRNDEIATQRARDFWMGWLLHPLVFGDYPSVMKKSVGSRLPAFSDDESKQVKGSIDFLGVIHYMTAYIKDNPSLLKERDFIADMGVQDIFIGNFSKNFEYPVIPWGLEGLLEYLKQSYGNPPIYILENGDLSRHNSSLDDTSRVKYIHAYLCAVLNAVRNGSNTRGYFVWSFLDLFELLFNYDYSFGLYYVDFTSPDLKRSPKFSAHWYSGFLKGMAVSSEGIIELQKNFSTPSYSRSSQ